MALGVILGAAGCRPAWSSGAEGGGLARNREGMVVMGAQDAASARLGSSLRERRRAAGLTQRQLAQRSGLSVAAVSDWGSCGR